MSTSNEEAELMRRRIEFKSHLLRYVESEIRQGTPLNMIKDDLVALIKLASDAYTLCCTISQNSEVFDLCRDIAASVRNDRNSGSPLGPIYETPEDIVIEQASGRTFKDL